MVSLAWLTQGIAGVVGCIVAAIMTEKYHPRYSFLGYGLYGLVLFIACFFLSAASEREYARGEVPYQSDFSSELKDGQTPSEAAASRKRIQDEIGAPGEEGFCYNFKRNMRGIGYALMRREIYFLIIYFILDGLTNPSFADFTYFFYLNVIGISKMMFAMLTLIGQVCQVIGVILFE